MLSGIQFGDEYLAHPPGVQDYLSIYVELEMTGRYGKESEWVGLREEMYRRWEELAPSEKHLVATLVACLTALANPGPKVWVVKPDSDRFPKAPEEVPLLYLFRE